MPELPEVENITNQLKSVCLNTTIVKSNIYTNRLRYNINPNLANIITNQNINSVERRAKYIVLKLENGHILIHLGMVGRIYIDTVAQYQKKDYEHMNLYLNNNSVISFCDHRRFGAIIWIKGELNTCFLINKLGLEPFSIDFKAEYMYKKCIARKVSIKVFLLENKTVVGIGNIYASEILFYSNIRPDRKTNTISLEECKKICEFTRIVLLKAIKAGGTSIRDFKHTNGKVGSFAQQLVVYSRDNRHCLRCNTKILKIIQNSRSSYFCPNCQI